jgi:glycosyltransferase involved in cell wall biosynthesis
VVSVVVVTHNDRERVVCCLESLHRQDAADVDVEILVIDDGSDDGTADVVARRFPQVRAISKRNEGADISRNLGIEQTTGEIIAFIDSDCTAATDWLSRLVQRLAADGGAAVGGRVLHRGSFWQRLTGIADFGEFLGPRLARVRSLPTCNFGVTRALLGDTRFDPRLARAGGDTLFSESLARSGAKLIYDPAVVVVHRPSASAGELLARARRYGRSFVEARKVDPKMRYAGFVRAGVLGVTAATLGRALLDWGRLLRHWRIAGFSLLEIPAAMAALLLRRVVSLPEAVRAVREPGTRSSDAVDGAEAG